MKGMQKIKRGSGFKGVLDYATDKDSENELDGAVIGGNMLGTNAEQLAAEFGLSRRLRPDVDKPVWHNSLRLPKGDRQSPEDWVKQADDYMQRMGFSDRHQRAYIMHDDKDGQHIHIVASRIALDGTLYLGKNENLKSTKIISQLEKDYGLTITKGANYDTNGKVIMPDVSAPSKAEMDIAIKRGEKPERLQIKDAIDAALANGPVTATSFCDRLSVAGIRVVPNVSQTTGKLNGFSFGLKTSELNFSGSKIGAAYKLNGLISKGLNYDKERDFSELAAIARAYSAASSNRDDAEARRRQPIVDTARSGTSGRTTPGDVRAEPGLVHGEADRARPDHHPAGRTAESRRESVENTARRTDPTVERAGKGHEGAEKAGPGQRQAQPQPSRMLSSGGSDGVGDLGVVVAAVGENEDPDAARVKSKMAANATANNAFFLKMEGIYRASMKEAVERLSQLVSSLTNPGMQQLRDLAAPYLKDGKDPYLLNRMVGATVTVGRRVLTLSEKALPKQSAWIRRQIALGQKASIKPKGDVLLKDVPGEKIRVLAQLGLKLGFLANGKGGYSTSVTIPDELRGDDRKAAKKLVVALSEGRATTDFLLNDAKLLNPDKLLTNDSREFVRIVREHQAQLEREREQAFRQSAAMIPSAGQRIAQEQQQESDKLQREQVEAERITQRIEQKRKADAAAKGIGQP
jgi:hypothetical protein